MNDTVIVQYVGFESKLHFREYSFLVREHSSEPREFTVTVANEEFDSHRLRYQDAPDICSLKLRRELAVYANHPPESNYPVSGAELDDYRDSHAPKVVRSLYPRKVAPLV
jgi:hypothetical protein